MTDAWQPLDLDALRREAERPALFLDDGGVLNDNSRREVEWPRLIGEFMPRRLGGTARQWADANRVVFPNVWRDLQARLTSFADHGAFQRAYASGWVQGMCAAVGVAGPGEDEAVRLYADLSVYVAERADSAIAGAAEAVRDLRRAGFRLHTASGTTSWELEGIMRKMGIAKAFLTLCGPDLVDQVKHGPEFYRRVFARAGVERGSALVIESDVACCRWAVEAGGRAAWIDPEGRGDARTLAALAARLT